MFFTEAVTLVASMVATPLMQHDVDEKFDFYILTFFVQVLIKSCMPNLSLILIN